MKILFTLFLSSLGCLLATAQIQQAWQYDFDASQTENPNHTFTIAQIRTSDTHYCLAEYRSDEDDIPSDQRVVILDPAGNQIWISANLSASYGTSESPFSDIEIQRVGSATATFGLVYLFDAENFDYREVIFRFDQSAAPSLSTLNLGAGEFLALQKIGSSITEPFSYDTPASRAGESGFFTTFSPSASQNATSIRRYLFSPATSLEIIAKSGVSSGSAILTWQSEVGISYQVQTTTDPSDTNSWTNLGGIISGTGSEQTWTSSIQTASTFFRLLKL